MEMKLLPLARAIVALCLLAPLAGGTAAPSPTFRVIFTFSGVDGSEPYAGLTIDASGDLYGTTYNGGYEGTVFRLSPGAHRRWNERVLYNFSNPSFSGGFPLGDVALDANGDVYGTAGPGAFNNGVAFELARSPVPSDGVLVLHTFKGDSDGIQPRAGLIFDAAGDLYGTTSASGPVGGSCGTVFQLVPAGDSWTENILHIFTCKRDGYFPTGDLVFDGGNLYGTTAMGGVGCRIYGCGEVFEVSHANGVWTKSDVYNFKGGSDGIGPMSALVVDKAGDLFGTTAVGGVGPCLIESTPGCGTVFELTRLPKGGWKHTVIYSPDGSAG